MRRGGAVSAVALAMSGVTLGQAASAPHAGAETSDPTPMLLWVNGAPGAQGDEEIDRPTPTAYLPASNPTKTAVVIASGGRVYAPVDGEGRVGSGGVAESPQAGTSM